MSKVRARSSEFNLQVVSFDTQAKGLNSELRAWPWTGPNTHFTWCCDTSVSICRERQRAVSEPEAVATGSALAEIIHWFSPPRWLPALKIHGVKPSTLNYRFGLSANVDPVATASGSDTARCRSRTIDVLVRLTLTIEMSVQSTSFSLRDAEVACVPRKNNLKVEL